MDTKHSFAFTIPYNPSDVKLHDVNLPPVLVKKGLATVLRKVWNNFKNVFDFSGHKYDG